MYKFKHQDRQVSIDMADELKKSTAENGVNFVEVYRLLESFTGNLLDSGEEGILYLKNEDTNASIEVDLQKNGEEIHMQIMSVNMANVNKDSLTSRPRGAKYDFNAVQGGNPAQS